MGRNWSRKFGLSSFDSCMLALGKTRQFECCNQIVPSLDLRRRTVLQ